MDNLFQKFHFVTMWEMCYFCVLSCSHCYVCKDVRLNELYIMETIPSLWKSLRRASTFSLRRSLSILKSSSPSGNVGLGRLVAADLVVRRRGIITIQLELHNKSPSKSEIVLTLNYGGLNISPNTLLYCFIAAL